MARVVGAGISEGINVPPFRFHYARATVGESGARAGAANQLGTHRLS
jgi:hypothetical protein